MAQDSSKEERHVQEWDGSVSFDLHIGTYHSEFLRIDASQHAIRFNIRPGKQVFKSPAFDLGRVYTAGGHKLTGYISFGYEYDEHVGEVVIAGADFPSADGMALLTSAEGIDEYCIVRSSTAGFLADEGYDNRVWNCHSQLLAEGHGFLKRLVRSSIEALIAAVRSSPMISVVERHLLPRLPSADYNALCDVRQDGVYRGTLRDVKDRTQADTIGLPESIFGGKGSFKPNDPFANVIGSTCDKHIKGKNWLPLWKLYYNAEDAKCASTDLSVKCNKPILGGHVVRGQQAKKLQKGSDEAMIIPICDMHNKHNEIYMLPIAESRYLKLKEYMSQQEKGKGCPKPGDEDEPNSSNFGRQTLMSKIQSMSDKKLSK